MMEDSLKDTEILGKSIGSDIKSYIKTHSNEYTLGIKNQITLGFQNYFSALNSKIQDELYSQEESEKNLHQTIEKLSTQIESLERNKAYQKDVVEKFIDKKYNTELKAKAFSFLFENAKDTKRERKLENQVLYLYISKLKTKAFSYLKKTTVYKPIKQYENEIKEKTQNDLQRYEEQASIEKEEILKLIYQAEEKLKHENRKKIQTKLLLDQVVLRGVSAMNLQALSLSNDALKGNLLI